MKKVGIVCCSNGQRIENKDDIKQLENTFIEIGLQPVFSQYIYQVEGPFSASAKERAEALMNFYRDTEIEEIFDISGGDLANGVLPYLDYDVIAKSNKKFWGYSDLSTIINAIYAKTKKQSVLYQVMNMVSENRNQQMTDFKNTVINQETDLYKLDYEFIQQKEVQGVVIGGNIRCFLKLAGTEYMPDFTGKILLLEGLGGMTPQMDTYLNQLQQLGAFDKVAGILLGTFTVMEKEQCIPDMKTLVLRHVDKDMPVAMTRQIGHGTDAKGIIIGKEMEF